MAWLHRDSAPHCLGSCLSQLPIHHSLQLSSAIPNHCVSDAICVHGEPLLWVHWAALQPLGIQQQFQFLFLALPKDEAI